MTTLDAKILVRVGILRNEVKRRFLWRFGRERSCSEEGRGSPRWVMTLVFIARKQKLLFTLPAVGVEMVLGGQNSMRVLRPSPAELVQIWSSIR